MSRPRDAARGAVGGVVVAGLIAALAGCFLLPRTEQTRPPEVPPAGLERFYGQELDWSACESAGLECATLIAPIDYADPESGDTELALIRKPTTSRSRVGSLLVNPGGPGGSGYDFVRDAVDFVTSGPIRSAFDVVGWDPRGVGRSSPVQCYGPDELDEYLYGVPVDPVGSDAWLAERAEAGAALAAACLEGTGPLLGHIDAASTARDMDLMRAVLGDRRLTYLGFSYGTVFGAQYADLFPERAGRLVLDGATDPSLPQPAVFTAQMAGFDGAYRAFLAWCVEDDGCPFTGSADDAAAQSVALFAGVDGRALTAGDGRRLTSPVLGTALAYPLYDEGSWPALAAMLGDLQAGEADAALEFADGYNGRLPDGTYESNSVESYTAALCLDGVYSRDAAGTRATLEAIEQAAPITGKYLAYSDWVSVDSACRSWPAEPVIEPREASGKGAPPILVLGTTNDPATPYAWAESLAAQLESGLLVTRDGEGHTAYARGNECIDSTVDAFLLDGTVPASDPRC